MRARLGTGLVLAAGIAIGFVGGLSVAPQATGAYAAEDLGTTLKRMQAQVNANTAEIRKLNLQLAKVSVQTREVRAATHRIATQSGVKIDMKD